MYEIELSKKAAKFYRKADTATARRLSPLLLFYEEMIRAEGENEI
ncbi:hypothetical protein VU01_11784 [Candidatus Electrothrix marina]|uniref:Uncharacterized protein n=1 Tax=Candidatus Electrothrix marina TaxID=1859130 RepID=A0A3S3UDR4_9BACT|nr:hypothetical protein VU00_12572 [Candidatus Electrothrix marina]RWX51238.1 hypothetical protein VU01_11784 [Candidatus Electrothrix marina]